MAPRKNKLAGDAGAAHRPTRPASGRTVPYSAWLLAIAGTLLIGIGLYFLFVRPPLLPEDPRYIGASLAQIDASVPGLATWLQRVFWVMGGYMLATGLLTCYIAMTSFRIRQRGAALMSGLAGASSIGWMAMVNFMLDSDFKWLLLLFALTWVAALVRYRAERRAVIAGTP